MSVYRKSYTTLIPAGAETVVIGGVRHARWKDRNGRTRRARIVKDNDSGTPRILLSCATYMARYRDGHGLVHVVSTGCRTLDGARRVLADLRQRAELVRAGVMSAEEDQAATHQPSPIGEHIDQYLRHLVLKSSDAHVVNVKAHLLRLADECRIKTLQDVRADRLVSWMAASQGAGMGPSTLNTYRAALIAFAKWCVQTGRLVGHPLLNIPRANEKSDVRHQRRALTEEEMKCLLVVARLRPVAEYGRDSEKTDPDPAQRKRSNWRRRALNYDSIAQAAETGRATLSARPQLLDELERTGQERALVYKTLLLTGLRKGELASITIGQVVLDGQAPHVVLAAGDAKNGQEAHIRIRNELAAEIRTFLDAEAQRLVRAGQPLCFKGSVAGLDPKRPLFNVPDGLCRILNRDLAVAGIPKRDARGRVLDVHALRHTFGTQLQRAGVPLRTAQAAMRHSTPVLTANVYCDTALLDVAGAIDALPALPLDNLGQPGAAEQDIRREGSTGLPVEAGRVPRNLAQNLAHGSGRTGLILAIAGKSGGRASEVPAGQESAVTPCKVGRLATPGRGRQEGELEREKGFEPSTFTLAR